MYALLKITVHLMYFLIEIASYFVSKLLAKIKNSL